MISAAAVLACALDVLGRPASSLPPIELLAAPRLVTARVEGFVRPGSGVITVLTDSDVFERARDSYCEDTLAVAKLASIVVHEEWHVLYGGDERGAYEAQLEALARLGVPPETALYRGVRLSMVRVIDGAASRTLSSALLDNDR